METLDRLDAEHLRASVVSYRDALRAHQDRLNRLNVYPVPDGDTGTNMALTLESVVAGLGEASDDDDMAATCKAISHGSLMGARGNSGVILSQVLRGLCQSLSGSYSAGGADLAGALAAASDAAYKAVMHPVEGTILTVVRESSAAAVGAGDRSLGEVLDSAVEAARESLERTPDLLPVLAAAGVVDAGGAGFVLFLDAVLHVVDGRPLPEAPEVPDPSGAAAASASAEQSGMQGPRYEVMYLLEAPDDAVDTFKATWDAIGESIVVVGGDGLWNCHIHTDDIGASIEAGVDAGRPKTIRVTDLSEQVQEESWVRQGLAPTHEKVKTGVVAVGLGAAVEDALRALGAQRVVAGGQTMNPSTQDLLDAIDGVSADEVVILPNNKNVVPVAEQAAKLASRPARVVPTKGLVEGLAALLAYEPDATGAANAEAMAEAAGQVVSGHVTQAVRDAGEIAEGDWLGLAGDKIVVVRRELAACAVELLDTLVEDHHELVMVIEGETATAEATGRVREWLESERPKVAVDVQCWRQ
ncbi:MAG: fatty acid kinase, partial [Actinomycetota bacterium]|nr:fatty acid kinase [Actinomycetota bacterium]